MTVTLPKLTVERVLILAVLAFFAWTWWSDRGGRGDGDYSAVEKAANQAIENFREENAAMAEALAKGIRGGKITTDRQALDWLKRYKAEGYPRAFSDLSEMFERDIPRDKNTGELDPVEAAAFFEAQADGFRGEK